MWKANADGACDKQSRFPQQPKRAQNPIDPWVGLILISAHSQYGLLSDLSLRGHLFNYNLSFCLSLEADSQSAECAAAQRIDGLVLVVWYVTTDQINSVHTLRARCLHVSCYLERQHENWLLRRRQFCWQLQEMWQSVCVVRLVDDKKRHLSWCGCRCVCYIGLYFWHTAYLSRTAGTTQASPFKLGNTLVPLWKDLSGALRRSCLSSNTQQPFSDPGKQRAR